MSIYGVSSSTTSSSMSEMLSQLRKAQNENASSGDFATSFLSDKDTDGDGALSLGETDFGEDQFNSIDSDGDGYLSSEELTAEEQRRQNQGELNFAMHGNTNAGGMAASLISDLDADGDGALSSSELNIDEKLFSSIDTDGDGSLSADEISTDMQNRMSKMQDAAMQMGAQSATQSGSASEGTAATASGTSSSSQSSDEEYDELDLNEDGVVSAEELRQAMMSGAFNKSSASDIEDLSSLFGSQDSANTTGNSAGSNGMTATNSMDGSSYTRRLADQAYMAQMPTMSGEYAAMQGITI